MMAFPPLVLLALSSLIFLVCARCSLLSARSPVRAFQRRIQGVRCFRAFVLVCCVALVLHGNGSRWSAVDRGGVGSVCYVVSLLWCRVSVLGSALQEKRGRAQGQRFRIPPAPKLNKDERDQSRRDRERCWRMPTPPISIWRRIHQSTRALICVLLLQEGKQKAKFPVEVCMCVCNIYV